MFHMNQNMKVVLAAEPVDLRKSFNGLYTVARNELGEVPEDGALFIFVNRSRKFRALEPQKSADSKILRLTPILTPILGDPYLTPICPILCFR